MMFFGGWIRSDVSGEVRLIIRRTVDGANVSLLMRAAEAEPILSWIRMNLWEYLRK